MAETDPVVRIKLLQREIEIEKERQKLLSTTQEKIESEINILNKQIELEERELALREDLLKVAEKVSAEELKFLETKNKEIEKLKQQRDLQAETFGEALQMYNRTQRYLTDITGISESWKDTFLGGLIQSSKTAGGLSVAISQIGKSLKNTLSPANVLGSLLQRIYNTTKSVVLAYDAEISAFNAATGAGGKYNKLITDVAKENRNLGISVEESAKSIHDLKEGFMDFSTLNEKSQNQLTKYVATMKRVGVDTREAAASLQILTRVSGQSIEESTKSINLIGRSAQQLGFSVGDMVGKFSQSANRLAVYGKRMTSVFVDIMKASKETGVEVNSLIDAIERFDTFEGAADVAGKLNAILGGNLVDSMSLLRAEGVEKLEIIKRALDSTGQSFDSLDRHLVKTLSSITGFSSQELAGLMNAKNISTLRKEYKNFEEEAKRTRNMQEQLNQLMQQFSILIMPIIETLKDVLVWVNDVADRLGGWFTAAIVLAGLALAGLISALPLIIAKIVSFGVVAGVATPTIAAFGTASAGSAAGVAALGTALTGAGPGMLMFAAAIAAIGVAIAAASWGISFLVDSFSNLFESVKNLSIIKDVFGAIGSFSGTHALNFKVATEGLDDLMKTADTITPVALKNTEMLVDQVVRYKDAQINVKNTETLEGLIKSVNGLTGGIKKPIVLQIGDRPLKKFVIDVLNDETNPRKM